MRTKQTKECMDEWCWHEIKIRMSMVNTRDIPPWETQVSAYYKGWGNKTTRGILVNMEKKEIGALSFNQKVTMQMNWSTKDDYL